MRLSKLFSSGLGALESLGGGWFIFAGISTAGTSSGWRFMDNESGTVRLELRDDGRFDLRIPSAASQAFRVYDGSKEFLRVDSNTSTFTLGPTDRSYQVNTYSAGWAATLADSVGSALTIKDDRGTPGEYLRCDSSNHLVDLGKSGTSAIGTRVMGDVAFFGGTPLAQQTINNTTNNITSGGSSGVFADWSDLSTYANDASTIRATCYQMARSIKQITDALRGYGLGV